MPTITSARDKNHLGRLAMELGLEDEVPNFMITAGAVEVPQALITKIEAVMKDGKKPELHGDLLEARRIIRQAY